jgi:molecular chaperone GrpE
MSASEQENQGPVIKDRRRIDPVTGQPRQPAAEQAQPGEAAAGQAPRGPGQPRPGKHAVSKPGSVRPEGGAGGTASAAGSDSANQPDPASSGEASSSEASSSEASSGEAGSDQAGNDQSGPDQAKSPEGATSQPTKGTEVAAMLAERTADLQRVQAEYANYRKRVERDRVAVREHALASVVAELLPVLDDIGRAREHDELTGGFKAVAEALEAAATKLGLTPFGEAGEPFDPNVHEALMHSYSPDVTEPTCVQILQPGYKVGERILRPARVAVAEPTDPAGARPAAQAPADAQGGDDGDSRGEVADGENAPDNSDNSDQTNKDH